MGILSFQSVKSNIGEVSKTKINYMESEIYSINLNPKIKQHIIIM